MCLPDGTYWRRLEFSVRKGCDDMTVQELVERLREYAEWAEANNWEVPIMLPDVLTTAAEVIETEVIGKCQDEATR